MHRRIIEPAVGDDPPAHAPAAQRPADLGKVRTGLPVEGNPDGAVCAERVGDGNLRLRGCRQVVDLADFKRSLFHLHRGIIPHFLQEVLRRKVLRQHIGIQRSIPPDAAAGTQVIPSVVVGQGPPEGKVRRLKQVLFSRIAVGLQAVSVEP